MSAPLAATLAYARGSSKPGMSAPLAATLAYARLVEARDVCPGSGDACLRARLVEPRNVCTGSGDACLRARIVSYLGRVRALASRAREQAMSGFFTASHACGSEPGPIGNSMLPSGRQILVSSCPCNSGQIRIRAIGLDHSGSGGRPEPSTL